jgi:hypothetical protein
MPGRWRRVNDVPGRLALAALAMLVLTGAAPAAPDDELTAHTVPDAVVASLKPGGALAIDTSGLLDRQVITFGTPILLVRLDVRRFVADEAARGGSLRVREVSDPTSTEDPYLWLTPVLAEGGPAGYVIVHEDGTTVAVTSSGSPDPEAAAVVALPPVEYLVETQIAGLWAVRPAGTVLPVDEAARKLLAARFDRPPERGLAPDEFRAAMHAAAVAADAAQPGRLPRPLVERILGAALACVGVVTLGLVLPSRRRVGGR